MVNQMKKIHPIIRAIKRGKILICEPLFKYIVYYKDYYTFYNLGFGLTPCNEADILKLIKGKTIYIRKDYIYVFNSYDITVWINKAKVDCDDIISDGTYITAMLYGKEVVMTAIKDLTYFVYVENIERLDINEILIMKGCEY